MKRYPGNVSPPDAKQMSAEALAISFIKRVTDVVKCIQSSRNHEELCSESSTCIHSNGRVFWRRDYLGDKGRCL